jgi:hypothetical protein
MNLVCFSETHQIYIAYWDFPNLLGDNFIGGNYVFEIILNYQHIL